MTRNRADNPLNCEEFEVVLADYLDGTLSPAERSSFEEHADACPGCRAFVEEARAGLQVARGAREIAPPPDLVTRIAYQAPIGRTRKPFERQGFLGRLASQWVQPFLQPRFAMGMAMTILSFAMLERCTGIRVQHIDSADLNPVKLWQETMDRTFRFKDRAEKYYENIRLVYDIEVRLRDMEQQQAVSQDEVRRKRTRSVVPASRPAAPVQGQASPSEQMSPAGPKSPSGEIKK